MPRSLIALAAALACGCNEIRYQASRIDVPRLEIPKAASLPDRRATYECKDGEPFDLFLPPGGAGAVLSIGGDEFALRELETGAGKRYSDGRYELYMKEDGSADLAVDDKKLRTGCRPLAVR